MLKREKRGFNNKKSLIFQLMDRKIIKTVKRKKLKEANASFYILRKKNRPPTSRKKLLKKKKAISILMLLAVDNYGDKQFYICFG